MKLTEFNSLILFYFVAVDIQRRSKKSNFENGHGWCNRGKANNVIILLQLDISDNSTRQGIPFFLSAG